MTSFEDGYLCLYISFLYINIKIPTTTTTILKVYSIKRPWVVSTVRSLQSAQSAQYSLLTYAVMSQTLTQQLSHLKPQQCKIQMYPDVCS